MAKEEKNKNKKTEEEEGKGLAKPYTLMMNHIHEDKRKQKKKFFTKSRLYTLFFVLLIVLVNLVVIFPLFKPGYPTIDSALTKAISQVNLVRQNMTNDWINLWYLGFPWYLFNNPLAPLLLALFKGIFSFLSLATILRISVAILYLAIPVSLYFLVRYISKKEFTALLSAFIFSVPPILLFWIPAVREMFANFGLISWQAYIINTQASAINHFLSLALIPLGLIFYLKTLREYKFKYLLITSILFTLIGFTNLVGLLTLFIISLIILASEAILESPGQKIRRALIVFLTTLGFLAIWFNIPYLRNVYFNTELGLVLRNLVSLIPLGFVVLPIAATLLFLVFDRKPKLQILFVSLVWVLVFGGIILAWAFWNKAVTPFPLMFLPELWMGMSILVAYLIGLIILVLKRLALIKLTPERANIAIVGLIVIFFCLTIGFSSWHFRKTNSYLEPLREEKIKNTDEYLVGQWLSDYPVNKERRVYVTGDLATSLNAFFNIPQVKGAADLGYINDLWQKASQEIEKEEEIKKTESYLRILGVEYIVVKEAEEGMDREKWDYYYPEKFNEAKILDLKEKIGPYLIYQVNLNFPSLVQVVKNVNYHDLQKKNFEGNLEEFANILDNKISSDIEFERETSSQFHIEAQLEKNQGLIIKENYYPTWQASLGGENISLEKDVLGFMYVKPEKSGSVSIRLKLGGGASWFLGLGVTIITLMVIILTRTKRVKNLVGRYESLPASKGVFTKPTKEASFVDLMTDHEEELERISRRAKEHYQKTEELDWVEGSDNFTSLPAYFHRNREALAKKLIDKFGFGDKYLEAGCGTGLLLRHLPKGSIGLDINPQNIARAKKNVPEAALVVADIENIPFPSNMFTTVICAEVLDRLPNPKKVIKEILRVLKPSGILIGSVPRENPLWRLRFLSSQYSPEPYRFEYSRKEIEELLGPFEKILISPALSYMTWAFVVKKKEGII